MATGTGTLLSPTEMSRINQQYYNDLLNAIIQNGFSLSAKNESDLQIFYNAGTEKLKNNIDADEYSGRLSYGTGQLIDRIKYAGPNQMLKYERFIDFLRSFCPLDPFC